MALFGRKKKEEKKEVETTPVVLPHTSAFVPQSSASSRKHSGSVLISPRITEKSARLSEQGAYAFNVAQNANKREIADAVRTVYNVTPLRVRIVHIPSKRMISRRTGISGRTASGKKAYVYLKKGDKIEVV
jgi:large subunit ribosomal protein L23